MTNERKVLETVKQKINYACEYHGNEYAPTLSSLQEAHELLNKLLEEKQ